MSPSEPPDFDKMDLDFSDFHPLDHSVFACRDYPGGWQRHLRDQWVYRWHPAIRVRTLCVFGFHRWGQGWQRRGRDYEWTRFEMCLDCYTTHRHTL